MNSLNEVTLLGLVSDAPKIKSTDSGLKIATFQIKTTEEYKDKKTDTLKHHHEWHDLKAFGFQADRCADAVKKGERILVRGHNRKEKWKDDKDQPHARTVILIDDLIALDFNKPTNPTED